ncbi:MAG TPA: FAD-dependent oxidoreductase [Candidatus Omnitrophica bacterium]|nr:FAD-dependent oxidoreductase [Candidatus Omnitrophota bacterium]
MDKKNIVVVGAGPAGMMAAIRAGQLGKKVTLLEKNPGLGRKLLLSGKGRCNLTNACAQDSFLTRFGKNGQFLRDAFKKFFNRELMDFFEKRGLALKVERQLRVFPVSNTSSSILDVLKRELTKSKTEVLCKKEIEAIVAQGKRIKGVFLKGGGISGV